MATEHGDAEVTRLAREWIDSLDAPVSRWRLSMIRKTAAPEGGRERPVRIRRFVEGCPPAYVKAALEYLVSKSPYTGVVFNGETLEGRYRPSLTYWRRDDQERSGVRGTDGTYTLVQDLVDADLEDAYGSPSQLSCSEEVVTEWHWDDVEPGTLPVSASQGVSYAIANVQRGEDGLFSWSLVKRRALTQHLGETTVSCNDLATVTLETWDNVYGPQDGKYLDDTGAELSGLPPSCNEPGTVTRMAISENPDCTLKISLERTDSKEDGYSWEDGTACRPRTSWVIENARTYPGDLIPKPEAGKSVTGDVRRNPDATWTARYSVTETPENEMETWRQGSRCRPVTVTRHHGVRTLVEAQALVPDPSTLPDGVSVTSRITRTDDCSYDVDVERLEPSPETVVEWTQGSTCRPTSVKSYQNSPMMPEIPGLGKGRTVDVSIRRNDDCTWSGTVAVTRNPASSKVSWKDGTSCRPVTNEMAYGATTVPSVSLKKGSTVELSVSRNADCTYDWRKRTVPAETAETLSWREGSVNEPVDVTTRVAATTWSVPAPTVGQRVSAQVTRNADCTYGSTVRVETSTGGTASWTEGSPCRPTQVVNAYAVHDYHPYVTAPGNGETVRHSVSRRPDGLWDVRSERSVAPAPESTTWTEGTVTRPRTVTRFENWRDSSFANVAPAVGKTVSVNAAKQADCTWAGTVAVETAGDLPSVSWHEGSNCRPSTTRIYRGLTSPSSVLGSSIPAGRIRNASVSPNPDGTYDVTVRETSAYPDSYDYTDGTVGATRNVSVTMNGTMANVPAPVQGVEIGASVRKNEDCTWDTTVATTTFNEQKTTSRSETKLERVTVTRTTHSTDRQPTASGDVWSADASPSDDGLASVTTVEKTPIPLDTGWITWPVENRVKRNIYKYKCGLRIFRNQQFSFIRQAVANIVNVDANAVINEYGLLDGNLSYRQMESWEEDTGFTPSGGSYGIAMDVFTQNAFGKVTKAGTARGRLYYGSGNEGAYHEALAHSKSIAGVPNLPGGVWTEWEPTK